MAGAGEIVDSVDANATVETNGWIKTIVDIVCAPGTAKSSRTEAENFSVRLVTRSTVETRRRIDASGHGIHCVFAHRSREIGRTDARRSVAGGMFVTRSTVETGEFGTLTERSQIVLIDDVSQ